MHVGGLQQGRSSQLVATHPFVPMLVCSASLLTTADASLALAAMLFCRDPAKEFAEQNKGWPWTVCRHHCMGVRP
jgi:hypothetical protein